MKKTAFALLLAGSVFFCGGWSCDRVRRDVVIEGVEVGGMTYAEAERAVRARLGEAAPFVVHTPAGDFSFSLDVRDDLSRLVRTAKKGETLSVSVRREWVCAEEELKEVCRANAVPAQDAALSFSARGFSYTRERAGKGADYAKTVREAVAAAKAGEREYTLRLTDRPPRVTVENLKARARPLGSFSTHFDSKNRPRSHNIALAAARIAGTTVEAGGEFSFNKVVGKRTAENGFAEANVILEGEFVPGVGGGVCQTSTTLFNAALRAGMEIVESRPHSLAVSYAPPSLDAMVSEYSDLKFRNPYPYPVYIAAYAGNGEVTFSLFGAPDGRRYAVESVVLRRVEPPPEEVVEGTEDRVLRAAKQGLESESYLCVYEGERLLTRTRIRRDVYACVRGKREVCRAAEGEISAKEPDFGEMP